MSPVRNWARRADHAFVQSRLFAGCISNVAEPAVLSPCSWEGLSKDSELHSLTRLTLQETCGFLPPASGAGV